VTSTDPASLVGETVLNRVADWDLPALTNRYRTASPWPHLVIDDPALTRLAAEAYPEVGALPADQFVHRATKLVVKREAARVAPGSVLAGLFAAFDSPAFVQLIEQLTGVSPLSTDPSRVYAGVQVTPRGGFQAAHEDFPRHPVTRLWHRANLLFYCGPWQPGWGGELELYAGGTQGALTRIEPLPGRMVIFESHARTRHGVPSPSASPEDTPRVALSCLFYSATPPAVPPSSRLHRWSGQDHPGARLAMPSRDEVVEFARYRLAALSNRLRHR
jgi:hypothetical protein